MLLTTKFLILIALLIAFAISFLFYKKNNSSSKLVKYALLLLRTLALFLVFLLLINPKITNTATETIKPNLIILSDNSASIKANKSNSDLIALKKELIQDTKIKERYTIKEYSFSLDIAETDSLLFTDKSTNISKALNAIEKTYKKEQNAILLLSDGNQTEGVEYEYLKTKSKLFPVIFGDTTRFEDVSITQLNVNKYAYLKHKFPVEVFVNYQGNKERAVLFKVFKNKQIVFSKQISLSSNKNSEKISFHLPANKVGINRYKATVSSVVNEKNKLNNTKNFSVEVIDEQAEIAIVSTIKHPDISALKRAIITNKQRKVTILHPSKVTNINTYALVVLYQPNNSFEPIFNQIKQHRTNSLIITGKQTDWNFLNNAQDFFSKKAINKTESYFGTFKSDFTTFYLEDIGFESFSPLEDFYGDVSFNYQMETILEQKINKITINQPLLGVVNNENQKVGFVFGEGLFKWSMSSYIQNNSKDNFNEFVNSLVQYLSLNKKSNLLEVEVKPFYYASESLNIFATYYDANYNANINQQLWIEIQNKVTKNKEKYPMIAQIEKYKIALNNLKQGNYRAKVYDQQKKSEKFFNFTILPYTLEEQLVRSNVEKMQQLAQTNESKLYFYSQINELKKSLLEEESLKSIQKEKISKKPFIQLHWMLSLLLLTLTIEWFIRKYNGLI